MEQVQNGAALLKWYTPKSREEETSLIFLLVCYN